MEDSYTVHRRRKAAARRREKTPEPSSRSQRLDTSEDEEEARRARMEKMAEDTERMERESEKRTVEAEKTTGEKEIEKSKARHREEDRGNRSAEDSGKPRAVSVPRRNSPEESVSNNKIEKEESQPVRKVSDAEGSKNSKQTQELEDERRLEEVGGRSKSKENVSESSGKVSEHKRLEKRPKKKSKERVVERHSRTSDSSDLEDKSEANLRRKKSPEGKIRVKKTSSKARATSDHEKSRERSLSSHKNVDEDREKASTREKSDRRHSAGRYNYTDTDDEPSSMKKSETFPQRSAEDQVMKRSATDARKQIIPLSNDSLIEDFAKAQRDYLLRERSILDPDPMDVFQDTQTDTGPRKRKISVVHSEIERSEIMESVDPKKTEKPEVQVEKKSWFSWMPFFGRKKKEVVESDDQEEDQAEESKEEEEEKEEVKEEVKKEPIKTSEARVSDDDKVTLLDFFRAMRDVIGEFRAFVSQNPTEMRIIKALRNRCVAELFLIMIYCGLGAIVFRFTEGAFETFYKCGVKRVKRDFLDSLWNYSHNLREDDWKSMARRKLMEFEEQLHSAHEAGVHSYSGQRSWSFLNAVVYCLTVITTIGYGHISPSTTTGRAITIVYAIFGIPMFLIILADFGKLFTRGIKFLWAFVRRVYYTGSCRKVRRTAPVQEVMKGVQLVYDLATFRRPSQMNPEDIEEMQRQQASAAQQSQPQQQTQTVLSLDGNAPDTPGTPAMSNFAIDDEFNLPISVAIFILLGYIFVGATLYNMWEDWSFFESFYFVFISMSTIGFGDYVPKHPIFMMCSIIYLVFGLALTSMCINVVQVMLSDSFKQASQKIGATIGFEIAEDDGSVKPAPPPPVELADVHASMKESDSKEKIAPRAKQEDVDL